MELSYVFSFEISLETELKQTMKEGTSGAQQSEPTQLKQGYEYCPCLGGGDQ